MTITVWTGDITEAPVEAICTSTNPHLTLMMGTGGAVRERGGFEVLRACEALLAEEKARSGRTFMPIGSAHVTPAGALPFRGVIHCVASGPAHQSSPEVVRACVRNALAAASRETYRSVAMPVFATGHAHVRFDQAVDAIIQEIRKSGVPSIDVVIVVDDDAKAERVRRALG